MQSHELLELTASEPLPLEKEYEMQRDSDFTKCHSHNCQADYGVEKWHLDEDSIVDSSV